MFFSGIHAYKVHIKHIRTVAYERQGKTVSYAGYIYVYICIYISTFTYLYIVYNVYIVYIYTIYITFIYDLLFMFIMHI